MSEQKIGYRKGLIKELSWSFVIVFIVGVCFTLYWYAFDFADYLFIKFPAIGFGFYAFLVLSILMVFVSLITAGNEHYNNFGEVEKK